ncbi:hypothetical protein [Nostoc sp.]|uniref:hypothetical protein n=1 Tax=Nostoc sp. TaxID=1180 RepID=UPI002FF5287B
MSAVSVNNWLVHAGLQYRTDDRKIPYRPTESGKQWGRMVAAIKLQDPKLLPVITGELEIPV